MSQTKKIILLAGKGPSTNILFHSLVKDFSLAAVIIENPVDRKTFIKKRIRKLGFWNVAGQIVFQFTVVKLLGISSAKRIHEILAENNLQNIPIQHTNVLLVNSVNDDDCLHHLQSLNPDIVVVNGTRIISKKILQSIHATFINIHAGITPKYRGVHGAYWALANNDKENCGVTVHLVDPGIDTGNIVEQQVIIPTRADNFATYPYLQLAGGIPLLKKALKDIMDGNLAQKPTSGESHLWYHPTLWQYLIFKTKGTK